MGFVCGLSRFGGLGSGREEKSRACASTVQIERKMKGWVMFLWFANIISSVGSVVYLSRHPPLLTGLYHPKLLALVEREDEAQAHLS